MSRHLLSRIGGLTEALRRVQIERDRLKTELKQERLFLRWFIRDDKKTFHPHIRITIKKRPGPIKIVPFEWSRREEVFEYKTGT